MFDFQLMYKTSLQFIIPSFLKHYFFRQSLNRLPSTHAAPVSSLFFLQLVENNFGNKGPLALLTSKYSTFLFWIAIIIIVFVMLFSLADLAIWLKRSYIDIHQQKWAIALIYFLLFDLCAEITWVAIEGFLPENSAYGLANICFSILVAVILLAPVVFLIGHLLIQYFSK